MQSLPSIEVWNKLRQSYERATKNTMLSAFVGCFDRMETYVTGAQRAELKIIYQTHRKLYQILPGSKGSETDLSVLIFGAPAS